MRPHIIEPDLINFEMMSSATKQQLLLSGMIPLQIPFVGQYQKKIKRRVMSIGEQIAPHQVKGFVQNNLIGKEAKTNFIQRKINNEDNPKDEETQQLIEQKLNNKSSYQIELQMQQHDLNMPHYKIPKSSTSISQFNAHNHQNNQMISKKHQPDSTPLKSHSNATPSHLRQLPQNMIPQPYREFMKHHMPEARKDFQQRIQNLHVFENQMLNSIYNKYKGFTPGVIAGGCSPDLQQNTLMHAQQTPMNGMSQYQINKEQMLYEQHVKNIMGEYQVATKKLEKTLEKTRHEMIKVMKGVSPNKKVLSESPEQSRVIKPLGNSQIFQMGATTKEAQLFQYPHTLEDPLQNMIVGVTLKSSKRSEAPKAKQGPKQTISNEIAKIETTSEVRKDKKLVILSKSPKKPTEVPLIEDNSVQIEYANIPQLNFNTVLDVIVPPLIETNDPPSPLKGQLSSSMIGLKLHNQQQYQDMTPLQKKLVENRKLQKESQKGVNKSLDQLITVEERKRQCSTDVRAPQVISSIIFPLQCPVVSQSQTSRY
ncbi:hypothetical protein FGO68_gene13506 [Halteria grandinella]|uniref:Uncharacterized protein n=1 Tax=Halteria grandinella TaxID=5974 RepID=A0A8J8P1G5_HALGN|nr:hypothetical protein FGO68_gene13506 [Halteria grandinella]